MDTNSWISLLCWSVVCLWWPGLWFLAGHRLGRRGWEWPALVSRLWARRE